MSTRRHLHVDVLTMVGDATTVSAALCRRGDIYMLTMAGDAAAEIVRPVLHENCSIVAFTNL